MTWKIWFAFGLLDIFFGFTLPGTLIKAIYFGLSVLAFITAYVSYRSSHTRAIRFRFKNKIPGMNFTAIVSMHGRAMVVKEKDGLWIYGVNPGAIAERADKGTLDFKLRLITVIFDMARDASDFNDFKQQLTTFFSECDADTMQQWQNHKMRFWKERWVNLSVEEV